MVKDIEKIIEKTNYVILIINGIVKHDTYADIIKNMDEIVEMYENDDIKKRYKQSRRIIGEMSRIILEKEKYKHLIDYGHAELHMLQAIRFSLLNIYDIAIRINQECVENKHQKIIILIQKTSNVEK